jgi:dTDP-4-amino-4,6-dideoxygalactose transaminase
VPDGKRSELAAYLRENGVGTGIYYPVPIHQQTYYINELGYDQTLPEAERATEEVLSLPVHPALEQADLETIVELVNDFMGA